MSDLIKRSLQIIGGGIKEATKDYTENLVSLKNDASIIRTGIMQAGKDGKETLQRMKSNNGSLKKISDWFYQRGSEFDGFDMSGADDDFDAGFSVDSSDDPASDTSEARVLDADSMKDIAKGQLSAMYNIGGKQAEMSMANTAEIVSSLNSRSSEMVAAINNVNTTLLSMSSKLDKLIELQAVNRGGSDDTSSSTRKNSVFDSSGKLSISGIFDSAKGHTKENLSLISMAKDMASMMTPETVLGWVLQETIGQKKFKSLGNKSIDDIGTSFNDAVGAGIQNALSEIIENKKFKSLFGDLTKTEADRDYGKIQPERYTTKQATFDEMTRHSIIHIIPEYLKKINENLSGEKFEIDEKGALSTNPKYRNTFDRAIGKVFEGGSGLSSDTTSLLRNQAQAADKNISSSDIAEASRVLTRVYTVYLHKIGKTNLRQSQLTADDVSVINMAVGMLTRATGKPDSFWVPVCMTVLNHLSSNMVAGTEFCTNVNKRLQQMIKAGETWAKSNNNPNLQAGKISYDSMADQYVESYKENHTDTNTETSSKSGKPKTDADVRRESNNTGGNQFNMLDYARGIFGILNRGINVRVTNTVKTGETRGRGYKKFTLSKTQTSPIYEEDSQEEITNKSQEDPTVSGGKGFLDTMIDKMMPRGIRISMQRFGEIFNNAKDLALGDVQENVETTDENGETVTNTVTRKQTIGEKVKQIMSPATDKLKPIKEGLGDVGKSIIGEKVTDEDGKSHRTSGLVQRIGSKIHTGVNDAMDRIIEKQEYAKVQNEVNSMSSENQDKIHAQTVLSLMQTAASDGETSEDIAGINDALNNIQDDKLRSKLQRSVNAMLKRSEKAPEKSGIGKILTSVIGKAFSGVKKIFSGILKLGGKLLKIVGKVAKAFFAVQKTGMSNLGRGLFGQKATYDEQGNQLRPETEGLLKAPLQALTKFAKSSLSAVTNLTKNVFEKVTSVMSGIGEKISGFFGKFKKKEKTEETPNNDGGSLTNTLNNLDESKLGFMQGLKDSLNEAKEAAKEALMSSPQNYGEKKLGETEEMLAGKKDSIFSKIKETIDNILKEVKTDDEGVGGTTGDLELGAEGATGDVTPDNDNKTKKIDTPDVDVPATGDSPKKGGKLYSLGQTVGGALAAAPMVMAIVSALSAVFPGFNELVETVKSIFFDALQPLNKVFTTLVDALKPVLEMVGEIITVIAEAVTGIIECLVDVIQPILEAVQPLLEVIFNVLEPILDLITGLIEVILAPLMGIIEFVVVPIIRHVGNVLEIMMGIVQVGIGIIISALGGLLIGIGSIVNFLTGNDSILDQGNSMWDMGTDLVTSGIEGVKSGIQKEIQLVKEVVSGDLFKSDDEEEDKEDKPKDDKEDKKPTGSFGIDGSVATNDSNQSIFYSTNNDTSMTGSGNTTINNYYGMYGSGNMSQRAYGPYMNMSERGCGPVALADAYSRRTGAKINPSQLASSMNRSGTYDPNRGTSVAGFIDTGRSMGMNVRAGGVTRQSLKQATPNNPITVIGSGGDFGTNPGNNHYMNVIGTDGHGGAYVANPLTGRVDRRSLTSVANTSKLGLYGSGDADYSVGFGEEFTEAFSKLTDLSSNWLSAFTGPSAKDKMQVTIDEEGKKEAARQSQFQLGDQFEKFETAAFEAWKNDGNAKRDNESDEDFLARFRSSSKYQQYLNNTSITDENGETISYMDAMNKVNNSIGDSASSTVDSAYGEVGENGERTGGLGKSLFEDASKVPVSPDAPGNSSDTTYSSNGNGVLWLGDSNEEQIWGYLVGKGMSKEGAAALMGNLEAESGLNPRNLQDTYEGTWRVGNRSDDEYTTDVDSGEYTRSSFTSDSAGYGLAQWTDGGRKAKLYDYTKNKNTSIGVLGTQLEYLWSELESSYPSIFTMLKTTNDIRSASDKVLHDFENPADQSVMVQETRAGKGTRIYNRLKDAQINGMAYVDSEGNIVQSAYDIQDNKNIYSPITAAALVFEGYLNKDPGGNYYQANKGSIELRDGRTIDNVRPDCSGLMSAAIKSMGYNLTVGDVTGFRTYDISGKTSNDFITDSSGNISSDWIVKRFDISDKQPGDIMFMNGHTGMFIKKRGSMNTGFDGGSGGKNTQSPGVGIEESANAGTRYLNGESISDIDFHWTVPDSDASGYPIIRYVGANRGLSDYIDIGIDKLDNFGSDFVDWLAGEDEYENPYDNPDNNLVMSSNAVNSPGDVEHLDNGTNDSKTDSNKSSGGLKTGSYVTIKDGATYYEGGTIPDWVFDKKWQISRIDGDRVVLGKSSEFSTDGYDINSPINKKYLEISGSGNRPPINDALYRSIMGSGDISSYTTMDIPPLDMSEYVSAYNNAEGIVPTTIVQRYEIKPDDTEKREQLRQILTNTYNVRAERVEELLEKILAKLDGVDKPSGGGSSNNGGTTPRLFDDDRIPTSVERLSVG